MTLTTKTEFSKTELGFRLLVGMFREIRACNVSDRCPHEGIGGKVSLSRQPDQTDSRRQPIGAPLEPSFVGIAVCDDAGESKAGRRVSRREGFATFPKFTSTTRFVRVLAISGRFKEQSDSVRRTHSFESGPTCIRCIRRPVASATDCVHQPGGAKFYTNADI